MFLYEHFWSFQMVWKQWASSQFLCNLDTPKRRRSFGIVPGKHFSTNFAHVFRNKGKWKQLNLNLIMARTAAEEGVREWMEDNSL